MVTAAAIVHLVSAAPAAAQSAGASQPWACLTASVTADAALHVTSTASCARASGTREPLRRVRAADQCSGTPAAPTGLSATVTGTTVTLSWTAPSECSPVSYLISAGSAPGLSNLARLSTGSGATTFVATAVPAGTYYVRVAAQSGGVTGLASAEFVVSVGDVSCISAPGSPSGLAAAVAGTSVTLTWSAATRSPSTYVVEAGSSAGLSNIVVSDLGSAATAFSATAAPGTYYVRLRAKNACGTGPPSNEIVVTVTSTNALIMLTGTQTLVLTGDVVIKNNITLHDDAVLTIENANFSFLVDYANQYWLRAYGRSKVIIRNSTLKASAKADWDFADDSTLQMTNVVNDFSFTWSGFRGRSRATAVNVSHFWGTVAEQASMTVDGAAETQVETVFPQGATVDESYPQSVGATPYVFPNTGESGAVFPRIALRNIGTMGWGMTYEPRDNITVRDTRSLTIGYGFTQGLSGVTVEFADLRAGFYADQTWTTGLAVLHLINTTTSLWYPCVSGNNTLIIRNSELNDLSGCYDNANVFVSDSSMTYVRTRNFVHVTLLRSSVAGDVVAADNSIIELTDSTVTGKIVREGNGQVILRSVRTTSRGFVIENAGSITPKPDEVISGRASIKGSSSGSTLYNMFLRTDPALLVFAPNHTYRITFKYRILTAPSRGFELLFLSQTAANAGNFLASTTITGAAGDSGVATLTSTLGPYSDYKAIWNVTGTGAIVIDDIQIINAVTGEVVASEDAETLAN